MQFKDIFRERYRVALLAARAGDEQAVVAALEEFHGVLEQQYKSKNGDSIIVKVELSRWMDIIGAYLRLAKESGLKDNKLREFFGLPALSNS